MSDITQNTPKLNYADNKTQPFKVCVDMMKIGLLLFTAPFLSRLFRALGRHNSKELLLLVGGGGKSSGIKGITREITPLYVSRMPRTQTKSIMLLSL